MHERMTRRDKGDDLTFILKMYQSVDEKIKRLSYELDEARSEAGHPASAPTGHIGPSL
jgi:hypothetical protein